MVIPSFSLVEASHIASGLWANGVATKSFPQNLKLFISNSQILFLLIMKI